jgi:Secretion system C-terminal sorting domain/Cleaved Adhesin Domain
MQYSKVLFFEYNINRIDMKKHVCASLLIVGMLNSLYAQIPPESAHQPDTLIVEHFYTDPTMSMAAFPSGTDLTWVNFDEDGLSNFCGESFSSIDKGWFYEVELSDTTNSVFMSCSFVDLNNIAAPASNRNWLILPPLTIESANTQLVWRSSPYQGPSFMDGYRVLVSNTTNNVFEEVFTDTIFKAAEMEFCAGAGCASLNLSSYTFSEGYIHANGFTNPDLYEYAPEIQANICFLEPHEVSLSNYVGQTIYIAFLHDSNNDFLLQLDDIAVVQSTVGVFDAPVSAFSLSVFPNPVSGRTQLRYTLAQPETAQLEVHNTQGQLVQLVNLPVQTGVCTTELDLSALQAGCYSVTLQTERRRESLKVLKY